MTEHCPRPSPGATGSWKPPLSLLVELESRKGGQGEREEGGTHTKQFYEYFGHWASILFHIFTLISFENLPPL